MGATGSGLAVKLPETVAVLELRHAVRSWLADYSQGSPVAVGLSGGADSLALAAIAVAEAPAVTALIVDHQLQAGSGEIAAAAARTARDLGCVRAEVLRVEVTGPGGMEAAARRARYAVLESARGDLPVLLAHTLDDQAETVLLGLGRGSGLRSIQGMAAWDSPWGRPFLGVRRTVTRQCCADLRRRPYEDPHNYSPDFTRVRLRREVLPLLEEVLGGGVAAALARTAGQLRSDGAVLDSLAEDLLSSAQVAAELDVAVLAGAASAVRRRAIRLWLRASGANALREASLRAVDELAMNWRGQGGVAVGRANPGTRLAVKRRHGRLTLDPEPALVPGLLASPASPLPDTMNETKGDSPMSETVQAPDATDLYAGEIESVLISAEAIASRTNDLAAEVARRYPAGSPEGDLILICVLKGAVFFMTDFAKAIPVPVEMEFMAVSSYGSSMSSSGVVRILKDLDRDIAGRNVVIVEDIIDSGLTLSWLVRNLRSRGPASLEVVTLLRKPEALRTQIEVAHVGFDIPSEFVVGYGLDYAERYRDLPYIGTLKPEVYQDR